MHLGIGFMLYVIKFNLGNIPVVTDFCYRDGGSGAPTAEEGQIGRL